MEENTAPAVIVTDGAAAADGGSPWIRISVDGEAPPLFARSRACVVHGVLSNEERRELRVPLERIADPAMWAGIVGTFIQVLKRPDAS
ncbi:hypothetical protein WS89_01655 [Burkholderia sp. MSMB1072]|uniref:hypothetical protein n=1 Tax=Burkholderia sp. MSMB1072 TaxID=1637871 RepID=UPI00075A7743|nr:hypothetical protein [Burkholderia sp. MSMB1072]KVH58724.1 hypothetical protein WS89_01655 [Burkholderia sp. MSMB1072]